VVKLVKQGYNSKSKRIKLVDGQSTTLHLILTKKDLPQVSGMTYITEGEFIMGAKNGEKDERPVHRVYVAGFYMDKGELTNREYQKFLEATGRRTPNFWNDVDLNKPELPVIGVIWQDAEAYCKWVGKRLPTEVEWEKAARGIDGRKYPWGNNYDNQYANSYGERDGFQFAAPVNSFSSGISPFEVLNMAGNVWEWCADWYAEDCYTRTKHDTFQGQDHGQLRVVRGGSWEDPASKLRTTNRYAAEPSYSAYNLGFRCAR
jgi:iron(II)-dependent oxidoreductase